jgi:integrase/recombinase XerD
VTGTEVVVFEPASAELVCVHASDDSMLLRLWLEGRPETTARAYARDAAALFAFIGKPLRAVTLGDLHEYVRSLSGLKPASIARKVASVKSLCGFAHRLGYLVLDVGRPLQTPRLRDRLAERIITEAEAGRMLELEPSARNHALLRLMYGCGLRVSEACGLCWRDCKPNKQGGQAAVHGKGGKTRAVLLQPKLWRQLAALRGSAGPDDPVLRSAKGGPLDRSRAHRIVKAAVARAGLPPAVSAHWLRHAHASHSLDRGAPLHVLQGSLGHGSLTTTTRYVHARPGDGSARYLPE